MGLNQAGDTHASSLSGWILPATLAAAALLLLAAGDIGREWLRWDRGSIADGEFWRLVTGHIAHLGISHALLNIAGLVLVWYLVGEALTTLEWLLVLAVSFLSTSAGLWFLSPEVGWYVGLSGALHGLLAAGVIAQFRLRTLESSIIAVVVVTKLVYEQIAGPLPGSESTSGGHVVVDAHLYGLIGGTLAALALVSVRNKAAI